jgi:hypothetical protein
MRRKKLAMTWVHLILAVMSLLAGLDTLADVIGWKVPFVDLPQYLGLIPVSVSMLLRSVTEFQEAEKEFTEISD